MVSLTCFSFIAQLLTSCSCVIVFCLHACLNQNVHILSSKITAHSWFWPGSTVRPFRVFEVLHCDWRLFEILFFSEPSGRRKMNTLNVSTIRQRSSSAAMRVTIPKNPLTLTINAVIDISLRGCCFDRVELRAFWMPEVKWPNCFLYYTKGLI